MEFEGSEFEMVGDVTDEASSATDRAPAADLAKPDHCYSRKRYVKLLGVVSDRADEAALGWAAGGGSLGEVRIIRFGCIAHEDRRPLRAIGPRAACTAGAQSAGIAWRLHESPGSTGCCVVGRRLAIGAGSG